MHKKCCLLSVPMRLIWNSIRFVCLSTKWHFTNKNSHDFLNFFHTKIILRIASRRKMVFSQKKEIFTLEPYQLWSYIVTVPTRDQLRALYQPQPFTIDFVCGKDRRVCDSFLKPYNGILWLPSWFLYSNKNIRPYMVFIRIFREAHRSK